MFLDIVETSKRQVGVPEFTELRAFTVCLSPSGLQSLASAFLPVCLATHPSSPSLDATW